MEPRVYQKQINPRVKVSSNWHAKRFQNAPENCSEFN